MGERTLLWPSRVVRPRPPHRSGHPC